MKQSKVNEMKKFKVTENGFIKVTNDGKVIHTLFYMPSIVADLINSGYQQVY